jgi:hypothetical protein
LTGAQDMTFISILIREEAKRKEEAASNVIPTEVKKVIKRE